MFRSNSFYVLFSISLISACGGGGGGGSGGGGTTLPSGGGSTTPPAGIAVNSQATYLGETSAAIVSSENAIQFVAQVFDPSENPTDTILGKTGVESRANIQSSLIESIRTARDLGKDYDNSRNYNELKTTDFAPRLEEINIDTNLDCSGGGSFSSQGTLSDFYIGEFTTDFSNCREGEITFNGALVVDIREVVEGSDTISNALFSFEGLSVSDGTDNLTLNGTLLLDIQLAEDTLSETYNFMVSSNLAGDILLQNLIFTQERESASNAISETWTGRIYLEDYGYTVVSTEAEFLYIELASSGLLLDSGSILFTGAANSRLRSVAFNRQISVQLDADGDGIYELGSRQSIEAIRTDSTVTDSAPIAVGGSVSEFQGFAVSPDTHRLSGGLSSDQDGDFLSYSWSTLSAPIPLDDVLVSDQGVEVEAQISEPGVYVFSLLVEDDDANQSAADYTLLAPNIIELNIQAPWDETVIATQIDKILGVNSSGDIIACLDFSRDCHASRITSDLQLVDSFLLPHRPSHYAARAAAMNRNADHIVLYGDDFGEEFPPSVGYPGIYDGFRVIDANTFELITVFNRTDELAYIDPSAGHLATDDDFIYVLYDPNLNHIANQISAINIETGELVTTEVDVMGAAGDPNSQGLAELIFDPVNEEFYIWGKYQLDIFVQKLVFTGDEFVDQGSILITGNVSECQPQRINLAGNGNWLTDTCGRVFSSDLDSGLDQLFQVQLGEDANQEPIPVSSFLFEEPDKSRSWFYITEDEVYDGYNRQREYRLHAYDWTTYLKVVDVELPNISEQSTEEELIFSSSGTPMFPDRGYNLPNGEIYILTREFGFSDQIILKM